MIFLNKFLFNYWLIDIQYENVSCFAWDYVKYECRKWHLVLEWYWLFCLIKHANLSSILSQIISLQINSKITIGNSSNKQCSHTIFIIIVFVFFNSLVLRKELCLRSSHSPKRPTIVNLTNRHCLPNPQFA